MNYTMYYTCECGYHKSLNEGDDYTIKQCKNCYTIESFKHEMNYKMICLACGEENDLPDDYEFKEETCKSCAITGRTGVKEYDDKILFDVVAKDKTEKKCKVCKSKEFIEEIETCPSCRQKTLIMEKSSVW